MHVSHDLNRDISFSSTSICSLFKESFTTNFPIFLCICSRGLKTHINCLCVMLVCVGPGLCSTWIHLTRKFDVCMSCHKSTVLCKTKCLYHFFWIIFDRICSFHQ
ncbi:hypothetical protein V8G54_005034 [Vigna mungo]|uniref:Uncharacterized protein n=1 Tax=Vigna mungo TaxID=3915 RepID=A0AAQ3PDC9_VIGMU